VFVIRMCRFLSLCLYCARTNPRTSTHIRKHTSASIRQHTSAYVLRSRTRGRATPHTYTLTLSWEGGRVTLCGHRATPHTYTHISICIHLHIHILCVCVFACECVCVRVCIMISLEPHRQEWQKSFISLLVYSHWKVFGIARVVE